MGAGLLTIYALGLGIPFLLAAFFVNRALGVMSRAKSHLKLVEHMMGALLLIVGAMLLIGSFASFSHWLLDTFPLLSRLG